LAELVGETSAATGNGPSTSAGASQSKYKFVVNSTIVQHRSNTVDETTGKGHGRRGMHSAAGAYWNNEKDGMWSFKYEAAERMGLDVVVGIVWIWVG
jgi:dynein light chain Tctex-type 1